MARYRVDFFEDPISDEIVKTIIFEINSQEDKDKAKEVIRKYRSDNGWFSSTTLIDEFGNEIEGTEPSTETKEVKNEDKPTNQMKPQKSGILSSQKARKEYVCNKCKCTINPGDFYFKITKRFEKPKFRCQNCKPQRSELTNSEYLSWLYDLQDTLAERYDLKEEASKDEIIQELEYQKDELEARYDNIPEQLQYASAGETIQNRIDSLDSAISDLEALDYPEKEEINKEDYDTEEDYQDALEEAEDDYQEALDSYQEEIETIIGGIEE